MGKIKIDKEFMGRYLGAYSPVSMEREGQAIWAAYVSQWADEMHSDSYGNAWAVIRSRSNPGAYRVVIEAHCDEIAWIVSHVSDDGRVWVNKLGGSDVQIAPSKRVVVHTRRHGAVPGVFGWTAVHLRKGQDKAPELKGLFLDLGLDSDKKVAAAGVEVGNVATFSDPFESMGEYYVGRALDNKMGGVIIAHVARAVRESGADLPYDLYVVNCVQEEVGLHGAKMVAQSIRPDVAIVTDVCHNTCTPGVDKKHDCEIRGGLGPAISHTAQNHRLLIELIREAADASGIPVQLAVGSYGNDTMGFFLANGGVPTAIISLPLKYMHTTVEMAHKSDVSATAELMLQTLLRIRAGHSFKYHDF